MWQTLVAFLALLTITMLSFNHRQGVAHSQNRMVRNEVLTLASGKLTEELDRLSSLPFDSLGTLRPKRTVSVSAGADTLHFEVSATATYVAFNSAGQLIAPPGVSDFREVVLTVRGPVEVPVGHTTRLPEQSGVGQVSMRRVYSRLRP